MSFDRLVEEADYQHTSELFGGKQKGDRSLEGFIPKSEEDFLEYAELLAQKIRQFEVIICNPYLGGILKSSYSSCLLQIVHVPSTWCKHFILKQLLCFGDSGSYVLSFRNCAFFDLCESLV